MSEYRSLLEQQEKFLEQDSPEEEELELNSELNIDQDESFFVETPQSSEKRKKKRKKKNKQTNSTNQHESPNKRGKKRKRDGIQSHSKEPNLFKIFQNVINEAIQKARDE